MNRHGFYIHPGIGILDLDRVPHPPPLMDEDLPSRWAEMDEEEWWKEITHVWRILASWISVSGGTNVKLEILGATQDESTLSSDERWQRDSRFNYHAEWSSLVAEDLLTLSPESLQIYAGDELIFEIYEGWDGMIAYLDDDDICWLEGRLR